MNTYLEYIEQRETTFPTFLEMLMATYKLIQKAKATHRQELVTQLIDEEKLINVIHTRAEYQRVGFSILKLQCTSKIQSEFLVVSS